MVTLTLNIQLVTPIRRMSLIQPEACSEFLESVLIYFRVHHEQKFRFFRQTAT